MRIKRADFPPEAQEAIFGRMRAERERLAREFRAEGQRDRDQIQADVNRRVVIIKAIAERRANELRGEGEAERIKILAESLGKDPEFFAFRRSLEAYRKFLSQNTTVVLSSDAELFQFLDTTKASAISERIATVGALESKSGNLWSVSGTTVHLDGKTAVEVGGVPDEGNILFVEGAPQPDNSILATHVSGGVRGRLQRIDRDRRFTVSGQTVITTSSTQITASLAFASEVYVEGERLSGTLEASKITQGLAGELTNATAPSWTIGEQIVIVDGATEIDDGADQQGALVAVSVSPQPDGSFLALRVRLQQPAEEADFLVGPVSDLLAEWTLEGAGGAFLVGEAADVELGADQEGLDILVGFQRLADGSLRALRIRVAE